MNYKYNIYMSVSRLGGVVVSVLAAGPKGHGFKRSHGNGFLMATKIHNTPSIGWEVKTEAPCRKFLRDVKEPCIA
jgi:hypothetical protein